MATRDGLVLRGFIIWIIVAWGVGPLTASADLNSGSEQSEYAFQVDVPELRFQLFQDGSSKVEIEGFGTKERRPGAPDLDSKTYLIAIPPGATPKLEYSLLGQVRLLDRLPSPVATRRVDLKTIDARALARSENDPAQRVRLMREAARDEFEMDAALYAPGHGLPWVELGEIGYLRNQAYVPVRVRGARWDGGSRMLEVASGFDIRVRFEGVEPVAAAIPAPREPVFEATYRATFHNYEQGRLFRREESVDPVAAASTRAGTTPRRKIRIRDNGPVRLDHALLVSTGFLPYTLDTWRLENQGEPVPLRINDDGDGLLEPGEWVEFYGQAFDMDPHTILNTDLAGTPTDLFEHRDFTDENVYFLTIDTPGQATMTEEPAAPQFVLTPPTTVAATVHEELDDAFRPLGAADAWYWLPSLLATGTTTERTDTVALPGIHDTTLPLQVRVHLRGLSEVSGVSPDHDTLVTLTDQNDNVLGTNGLTFDGRTLALHDFGWTFGGGFQAGDPVKIKTEVFDIGGGNRNDVILDWIEVDYTRSFIVDNDRFEFVWPDGDEEIFIDGFTSNSIEVWELTATSAKGVVQPRRMTGVLVSPSGADFSARFLIDNDVSLTDGAPRRFLAFASGTVPVPLPADVPDDLVSDLREQTNQADLIVIAADSVLDASPGSPLDQLLAHRASAAGGSLTSKIVRLEDIYDEFNFGLEGPQAIREFLRWVVSTAPSEGWAAPKPTYLMLLGDGSFDYKGGEAQGNFVPTQIVYKDIVELGYYASDNLLATVVGNDQLADLVVGRLPARTLAEATVYLQKILDYETVAPAGAWRDHVATFADRGKTGNNPGEALEFELTNQVGLDQIGTQPYTSRVVRYWTDYLDAGDPDPIGTMRQQIKDSVNGLDGFDGSVMAQFSGHGSFTVWSDDAFFDERDSLDLDSSDLTNGLKLPFLFVNNCLSGGFHLPLFNTMGEDWLRKNGGGAVAVFAPSGLSFNYVGRAVTEDLWLSMFGPEKSRQLASLVTASIAGLCGRNSIEPCQNYVLLGDPATRLQLRSTDSAKDLSALASSLQVDLDWTASSTPGATYRVFRNQNLTQPFYVNLTPTPIAATQLIDTQVENTTTYYYHVIAVDPDGFESAWSNFNSDCAVSGPDCVKATPVNPNPPAKPTGLAVTDPGIGNQLVFSWDASPEPDLDYYTISWGQGSNNPANVIQVTGSTFTTIGLSEGLSYCAVVSATNTSGNTSAETTEVCDFPIKALGVRLPNFIDDLRVSASGVDTVLDWSQVTTDIYGKPASIVNYEILRGTAPDYSVAGLTKIGDCAAPCSGFVDPGAQANGLSQHYRVRAVNADTLVGALGSEAPRGVDLQVERGAVAGDVALSWSPAQFDLDGNPVDLLHYLVFASDAPLSKTDVVNGTAMPTMTIPGTSVDLTPQAQSRFYSVFVVDTRGNISPD